MKHSIRIKSNMNKLSGGWPTYPKVSKEIHVDAIGDKLIFTEIYE